MFLVPTCDIGHGRAPTARLCTRGSSRRWRDPHDPTQAATKLPSDIQLPSYQATKLPSSAMLDSSYLNTQTLQNRVHRKIDRTRIHADISARSLCHVRHIRSEAYGGNEFSSGGRGAQPHNRPCPCSSLWFSAAQRIMPCGPGAAACTGSGRTLQRSSLLRAESGVVRSLPRPTMKPFCTACARSSSAPGEWLRKTALDLLLAPTARGAERRRQDVGCRS